MTGDQWRQVGKEARYSHTSEHLFDECRRMVLLLNRAVRKRLREKPLSEGLTHNLFISDEDIGRIVYEPEKGEGTGGDPEFQELERAHAALCEQIDEKKRVSADRGIFLGLPALQELFQLTRFEMDVLILAILPELRKNYERILGYLQDDITLKRPTVGLIADLFSTSEEGRAEVLRYFLGKNALLHFDFLRFADSADQTAPFSSRALRVDNRIMSHIFGERDIDSSLSAFASLHRPQDNGERLEIDSAIQGWLLGTVRHHLHGENAGKKLFMNFTGPNGSGSEALLAVLCREMGMTYLSVDLEMMVGPGIPFEETLQKIFREGILLSAPLYFKNMDLLFKEDERAYSWRQAFFKTAKELSWITCFSAKLNALAKEDVLKTNIFLQVELAVPGMPERIEIWKAALQEWETDLREGEIASLARTYRFTAVQIADAVRFARNTLYQGNGSGTKKGLALLQESCRLQSHHKLASLAQRITSPHGWDDLVLPAGRKGQLREISDFIRFRDVVYDQWGFGGKMSLGRGLNILFSGPSGTGKTMAAGILAREFGYELYKIDLSLVVSKYIGETEKNLSKIFNEAVTSNAMLFFDEADALFGKRSEIKDAHDRYANIEINYLLQKMEEHEGIVILASNLSKNMDEAFLRRMQFVVEFPFPDEQQREAIWRNIFPENAPLSKEIDFEFLSERINLTGGNIKNIALSSAFYAADPPSEITMRHIMLATKREYQKLGRSFLKADFEPHDGLADMDL